MVIHPFREVVFSVKQLEACLDLYAAIGGYELVQRGALHDSLREAWHLPPQAHAQEVLLRAPHSEHGFLRLVQFEGVPQKVIRSSARIFDTGAIFDIDVRVRDIQSTFERLREHGFHSLTDPIEYTFGTTRVKEVLMKGHDDIVFALIERVSPPLVGWQFDGFSHVFNSSQIVRDVDAEVRFCCDVLGFNCVFQGKLDIGADAPNVLGLPANLVTPQPDVAIVSPTQAIDGSIEFLAMPHIRGTHFGDDGVAPNRGILSIRYPVDDLDAYHARVRQRRATIVTPPQMVTLAPYGRVRLMIIRTPNGAWLEFYETAP